MKRLNIHINHSGVVYNIVSFNVSFFIYDVTLDFGESMIDRLNINKYIVDTNKSNPTYMDAK